MIKSKIDLESGACSDCKTHQRFTPDQPIIIWQIFVDNTVFRLYQKFDVHSETDTGNILKEKVSQFLKVHAFEKKDVAEVIFFNLVFITHMAL